jgi:hypothetical protein
MRLIRFHWYRLASRPDLIIGAVCLIALGFLVLGPLIEIIRDALSLQSYDLA